MCRCRDLLLNPAWCFEDCPSEQRREAAVANLQMHARLLVSMAEAAGLVVTITTEPDRPLAMGNYRMVADVRPALRR